jgi:hypothetical protein
MSDLIDLTLTDEETDAVRVVVVEVVDDNRPNEEEEEVEVIKVGSSARENPATGQLSCEPLGSLSWSGKKEMTAKVRSCCMPCDVRIAPDDLLKAAIGAEFGYGSKGAKCSIIVCKVEVANRLAAVKGCGEGAGKEVIERALRRYVPTCAFLFHGFGDSSGVWKCNSAKSVLIHSCTAPVKQAISAKRSDTSNWSNRNRSTGIAKKSKGSSCPTFATSSVSGASLMAELDVAELSPHQQQVLSPLLQELCNGSNIFLTGAAKVGKSLLLSYIIRAAENFYDSDCVAVAAPSGHAAMLIGGKTLHSVFG